MPQPWWYCHAKILEMLRFFSVITEDMWPITRKATLWELWKVSTLVSLRSPRRLTTVDTFCYWQIFCVFSDNSTELNCHLEIIEPYQPVLALFLFSLLSRSYNKVPFGVMDHIFLLLLRIFISNLDKMLIIKRESYIEGLFTIKVFLAWSCPVHSW